MAMAASASSGAALREFLLAVERTKQPLDGAVQKFVEMASRDARLFKAFLDVNPQAQPVFHIWPDESGKGTRWEDRDSLAVFLNMVTKLLHTQVAERDALAAAEAMAMRIIREKSATLEKLLSWSDKPIIEFRVLELLTSIVRLGAAPARECVRVFNFQGASFAKIATRRMKKPAAPAAAAAAEGGDPAADTTVSVAAKTAAPSFQIRAAYVRLVAALTSCPDKSVHRFALKEGGVTSSLFKSIDGDDAEMLATVLGHLEARVLRNETLDTRGRTVVFNSFAVQQLVTCVKSEDEAVGTQAWAMLLQLFFEDHALYKVPSRESLRLFLLKPSANNAYASPDDATVLAMADSLAKDGNAENVTVAVKVIRNIIGAIGLNDYIRSDRVRVMVDRFILEFPGLVAEYIAILAPQLEPKPGYRWFSVASMMQRLLSSPLDAVVSDLLAPPATATGLDTSGGYTAQMISSRLLMPLNCRKELSRGLQHTNSLVIYGSLGIIECALVRFEFLQQHLPAGVTRSELENELRFLLPSPEALVSLLMKLCATVEQAALVYLRALTVFRLYLECLPQAMSEVKVDFTKLLAWQFLDGSDGTTSNSMRGVIVGEMLRILMVIDESRLQYVVSSSTGSSASGESKLSQLLHLYSSSSSAVPNGAVRVLVRGVLYRVLVALKVFGLDSATSSPAEEISVWLDNLATGGHDATIFVELLFQELVADPFSLLTSSTASSSPHSSASPATLALVAALCGRWTSARSNAKMDAVRQSASVMAFGSRVLLSLLCRSVDAGVLAQLVAGDDPSNNASHSDEEANGTRRATKKRRRSESIDLSGATPFRCVQVLAQQIASPSAGRHAATSSSPSLAQWKVSKNEPSFAEALFALDAASFVKHFSLIVQDVLELGLPLVWLHHYIGARPDLDLVALIDSITGAAKKDKQLASVLHGFVSNLPLHLLSQRLLFVLALGNQPDAMVVAPLLAQLKSRIARATQDGFQQDGSVALVAEQLLMCARIAQAQDTEDADINGAFADILLRLLVILHSAGGGSLSSANGMRLASKRLSLKLKLMVTSSSTRDSKLTALGMIAHAIGTEEDANPSVKTADNVVETIVLMKRLPVGSRLQMLKNLLSLGSTWSHSAVHVPLVSFILQTLDGTCSGFTGGNSVLSRRLWRMFVSARGGGQPSSAEDVAQQVGVLSSGLYVVARLGGISESDFRGSILSTWVAVLSKSLETTADFNSLVTFVRRLHRVIQVGGDGRGVSALGELIRHTLQQTAQKEPTHLVAIAACLVATFGTSAATAVEDAATSDVVLNYATQCVMRGDSNMPFALIVLRHVALMERPPVALATAVETAFGSLKIVPVLSNAHVLVLLLALRNRKDSGHIWSSRLATFALRAAIAIALDHEALTTTADGDADDEEDATAQRGLQTILIIVRDLLQVAPSESDVQSVLVAATTDLERLAKANTTTTAMYKRYVRATRIVVTLLLATKKDESKSKSQHSQVFHVVKQFEKLTSHASFVTALNDATINVELIRLVSGLLRLGGKELYTHSVFQHLLSAYNMSLTLSDRMLRALLDGFESKAGILASQYGYRFGSSFSVVTSQKQDGSARSDLIEDSTWLLSGGLEPARVRATIEWFPLDRSISVRRDSHLLVEEELQGDDDDDDDNDSDLDDQALSVVYDPSYLLPMLSRFVATSALSEAAMIQQGILGLALRAASSNAEDVREYAYGILAHVHEALSADAATDFKPGRQVHLLLDALRSALQEQVEGVSSVITVFMNDAISILCRPAHTMYPHVNHFLLARPVFDLSDVPMFYSLFNSHSPQTYKQERSWLLHGLRRGVREDADVSLLIRRHVPSILLSFFASELADDHTQLLVGSIVLAMLKTETGATYLLTKCGFLEWVTARFHEATASTSSSLGVLQSLSNLLEYSLQTELWNHVDFSQRYALSSAAVACYDAFAVAIRRRGAFAIPATKSQTCRIGHLLLQRTQIACSLATFTTIVDSSQSPSGDGAGLLALECIDELVTDRLTQHAEFQKNRFAEWSKLLSQVARILSSELRGVIAPGSTSGSSSSGVDREIRAYAALGRLRGVLAVAPSLKLLILEELIGESATAMLLL